MDHTYGVQYFLVTIDTEKDMWIDKYLDVWIGPCGVFPSVCSLHHPHPTHGAGGLHAAGTLQLM